MNKDHINKGFVDYETAMILKELRYDEPVIGCHLNKVDGVYVDAYSKTSDHQPRSIKAPLWQEVKSWLWEKYKMNLEVANVSTYIEGSGTDEFQCQIKSNDDIIDYFDSVDSPITAEVEGIKKAIQYLRQQQ